MKRFLNAVGLILIVAMSFISCNSNKSVQQYFLEKLSSPDFISLTLPASILNIAVDSLAAEEQDAVNSLKKLNVLVFHSPEGASDRFTKEEEEVTAVLNNSKYQDLISAHTPMGSGTIMFLGAESTIDEFLAFGSDLKQNFILIRVLGDNMNPKHIKPFIAALQQSDINEEELLALLAGLKPKQELIKKQL